MARTSASDPVSRCRFRVTIAGIPSITVNGATMSMGFNKVTGLKRSVSTIKYEEGGYDRERKMPGREKVEPVTLERGVFPNETGLYDYYVQKLTDKEFRTTVTVELLDKDGKTVVQKWVMEEAWISTWEAPDADASSEEVAIQKVIFEFEGFQS